MSTHEMGKLLVFKTAGLTYNAILYADLDKTQKVRSWRGLEWIECWNIHITLVKPHIGEAGVGYEDMIYCWPMEETLDGRRHRFLFVTRTSMSSAEIKNIALQSIHSLEKSEAGLLGRFIPRFLE